MQKSVSLPDVVWVTYSLSATSYLKKSFCEATSNGLAPSFAGELDEASLLRQPSSLGRGALAGVVAHAKHSVIGINAANQNPMCEIRSLNILTQGYVGILDFVKGIQRFGRSGSTLLCEANAKALEMFPGIWCVPLGSARHMINRLGTTASAPCYRKFLARIGSAAAAAEAFKVSVTASLPVAACLP